MQARVLRVLRTVSLPVMQARKSLLQLRARACARELCDALHGYGNDDGDVRDVVQM